MNRTELRTACLKLADAFGSQRWDATPGGEVDELISDAFDQLWQDILEKNEDYRVATRTPTADSTGRYLFSDLTVGAGDEVERLFRIKAVYVDGCLIRGPVQAKVFGAVPTLGLGGIYRVWYQEGDNLVVLPLQPGKVADGIMVNHRPQRPDRFEAEESSVVFPDGHERVLKYWGAAELLVKGGAETQAAAELRASVEDGYNRLLSATRISTNPTEFTYADGAADWGG